MQIPPDRRCFGEGQPQQFDRDIARKLRQINRQPEPFPDEFQERFLKTLLSDEKFRLAVAHILKGGE